MMISAEVIETSVTITDYLLSQILRSALIWKIKLRGLEVLLCSNYSLFNTNHKKWIIWNSQGPCYHDVHVPIDPFVNPFAVQNDVLVEFSLCHNSADYSQVAFPVCI